MSPNFKNHCEDIVRDFLRSVMIIDDQTSLQNKKPDVTDSQRPVVIQRSSENVLGGTKPKVAMKSEGVTLSPSDAIASDHALDAQRLTDAFFSKGIIAGLFKPSHSAIENTVQNEKILKDAVKISSKCDAVIIDWLLNGRDANLAKNIIKNLLENDFSMGGRLRTIIVYTAEENLQDRRNELLIYLNEAKIRISRSNFEIEFSKDSDFSISAPNARISFYGKSSNQPVTSDRRTCTEEELPDILVNEIYLHTQGLLPSFALKCVASIRDNTHHLLTRFQSKLDGAYLAHRLLLPDAEDAEPFMLENFVSIVRNTLSLEQVDRNTLGKDAIKAFSDGNQDTLFKVEFWGKELLLSYVDLFPPKDSSFEDILRLKTNKPTKGIESKDYVKIAKIIALNDENLHIFSVLTSFKRCYLDIVNGNRNHVPYLTQGSLIAKITIENNVVLYSYLLCVTPKCDCLRIFNENRTLIAERLFSFAKLEISDKKKFDVIANHDGIHKTLRTQSKFHELLHLSFSADLNSGRILAKYDELHGFIFSENNNIYTWIGDLKELQTQDKVSKFVSNLNRIGFDEFEWLRRINS